MSRPSGVTHAINMVGDARRYYGSAWYSEIVRRFTWRNTAYTKVFSGERALGVILQGLDSGKTQLTTQEERLMLDLAPFVAHALTQPPPGDQRYAGAGEAGLLVLDLEGKLLYCSPKGRELLFLTAAPRVSSRRFTRKTEQSLPPFLARLCRNLVATFAQGAPSSAAPSHTHVNSWGKFRYRAEWLDGPESAGQAIAVTIESLVPADLVLLRRIKSLGLPRKQADVCFHLARGARHEDIAKELGLSVHAIDWHTRQIYARLDVHNAAQLGQRLLSQADA